MATRHKKYIAATGLSAFGQYPGTVREMVGEAWRAGGEKTPAGFAGEKTALVVGNQAGSALAGEGLWGPKLAEIFLPDARLAQWVNAGSASGAAALEAAWYLLESPAIDQVIVIAFEKMRGDLGTDGVTREISKVLAPEEIEAEWSMVKGAAGVAAALAKLGRQNPEDWSRVAVKNHANGVHNPSAQFRKEISLEKASQSRIIADPLRLFHCSPISDGAALLVLTKEETDLELTAVASGQTKTATSQRDDLTSFAATRQAAARAWQMSGWQPATIDFAEIHDAFTPFELLGMEDCGLAAPGKAARWLREGRLDIDGSLPVNASGGLKSRGHPVGASGLAQVVEACRLLRGQGEVDFSAKRRALTMSIGGLATQNFVSLIERK